MKFFLKVLGNINPFLYGVAYLLCIPIFGTLLHYVDNFELINNNQLISDLNSAMYFSAVTITTLGYGDILPSNMSTRLLVIIEASLGVILAGLFLNSLAHKQSRIIQEADEKKFKRIEFSNRLEKLIAFNKLISLNLSQYEIYIIIMTSPYGSQARPYGNNEPDFKLNPNFKFSDIKHLYKSSGKIGDNSHKPAVDYFYNSLDKLVISLEQSISLDLFLDFKDLEDEVREFILLSRRWNVRDDILAQIHTRMGEEQAVIFYERMIENLTEEEMELRRAYMMNSFIILFHFLKQSCTFIEKYNKHINHIMTLQK